LRKSPDLFSWANKEDQMTDKTPIQRIKELDQERATLFEQAKEEALRRANRAVEDLNALGLNHRLVTGAVPAASKGIDKKPQETGRAGAEKRAAPPAGLKGRSGNR
jgi:hypothetical protein